MQKFKLPNEWWSLNIEFSGADSGNLYAVCLKKNKDNVLITDKISTTYNADSIKNIAFNTNPVCITLNGKGILHKKITVAENDDDEYILNQLLPGANIKDFYLQKVVAHNNTLFVSAVRKQTVDKVLELFQADGKNIIQLTLGPFQVGCLLPFLQLGEDTVTIHAANHKIDYANNIISHYSKTEDPFIGTYTIGSETIASEYLIPFASGMAILLDSQTSDEIDFVTENTAEQYQKNIFNFSLKAILSFVFVLLLINFLFFNQLYKKNTRLKVAVTTNIQGADRLKQLKDDVSKKELFLKQAGWFEASKTSFYADRIIALMPQELKLRELSVYPPDKEKNKIAQNEINFQNKRIFIKGITQKSSIVNLWIDSLKTLEWANEVKIENYYLDNQNGFGIFEVSVFTK